MTIPESTSRFSLPSTAAMGCWGLLLLGAVVQDRPPGICRHRGGVSHPLDPGTAERVCARLVRTANFRGSECRRSEEARPGSREEELPACRERNRRILKRVVSPSLSGKTLLWAEDGGRADLVFRSGEVPLSDLLRSGSLPGGTEAAKRWGVRCVPTRVRILSEGEIEIEEGGGP